MHNKITMIRILLLCCIIPRHALSQTVSWTVGTSVPRFKDDLKLDCTVSSDCCTNFDRIWANGTGSQFINSGNSASNKYVEDWNTSVTTGFSLIIKNLQDSDVEVEYDCQYRIGNDKHTLTQDATWEYPPDATEGCPKATSDERLIGTLHISKAAPYPYVSASFMGENVTTGLTVTRLTNFNTWFYRFTVSINTECSNDGRLIVTVVTGTKATTVCDKEIICKPNGVYCGLINFLWSFIGTVVGSSIMMAGILIIILEDFEDGEDDIVDRILTDDDSSEDFSYNRVLFLFLKVVRTFDEVKRIKKLLGDALKTFFASLAVCGVITLTYGYVSCACFDYADGSYDIVSGVGFIALGYILVIVMLLFLSYNKEYKELKCVLFLVALLLCAYITLFGYAVYISIKKKKRSKVIVCILILVICTQGLILVPLAGFIVYKAVTGSRTLLKSPFKATTDKKIRWFKVQNNEPKLYSEGKDINPNLQPEISSRLKVTGDHNTGEYHLNISNISTSDEGIYQCSLFGTENTDSVDFRQHLTVKSGKNQSVESGSSCWPICRVGQDPNSSSSGPEKVRRSPEIERADKKKERKPTEVVRPQPSRPLPSRAQHLKTDNTGREEYSAENELFKPRPLPSISGHSDSPRPLPKRTPDDQLEKGGIQLEPLVDTTSERKKRRKKKKKETRQSDEDD